MAWIDDPELRPVVDVGGWKKCLRDDVDYNNERVNEIIAEGWGVQDPAERQAMFEEAQRLIVEDAPWASLAQPDFKLAMRGTVTGFVLYPNEIRGLQT